MRYTNDDILVGVDLAPAPLVDVKALAVVPAAGKLPATISPNIAALTKNPYIVVAALVIMLYILKKK